ncbi:hypothetical protein [Streptomyces sp. KL116D]|uniref:hypothetical protein n=1 Tax=Streptomyces sp. KL116D TaxID=3045152 RepID=UPI003556EF87
MFFNDVDVPKKNLVGPQGEGWKVMLSNIELEKVIITGGCLFQPLVHAMADLQTETDSARRRAWVCRSVPVTASPRRA